MCCERRIAQVKANSGAPGIDQQTFEIIEKEIGVDVFLREHPQNSSIHKAVQASAGAEGLYPEVRRDRNDRLAFLSLQIVSCRQQ